MCKSPQETQLTLKAKLFLIIFGVGIALLTLEFGLVLLDRGRGKTDFEDINDLRGALETDGNVEDTQGGGVSLKSIIEPHSDNTIIYDLKPNLSVRFQRVPVATNSCGMRSPERPHHKAANTFRIALLGDSFAFGWGVEQQESFAQRIEDNLNRSYQGHPAVEVLNFGVPGYSTFQEAHQYLDKGVAFKPDAIVVFFIQNDFGPPFFIRNIGDQGLVPSSQIAQLAMKILDPHAPEKALLNAGLDPNQSLRVLADHAQAEGIPLFLAINPKKDWRTYLQQLWITKQRKDIRVMDLRKPFVEYITRHKTPTDQLTLSFDPHPSPLRHRIYGDIMTPPLMDIINK